MKATENLRQSPEYKPLDAWLETATSGLSAEDRARVRSEIVDWFQQDVEDSPRAGPAADAAAKAAVENLGSPEVARRSFRYMHLTRYQKYLVRRFVELPQPPVWLATLTPLDESRLQRSLRPFVSAFLILGATAVTVIDQRMSPPERQARVALIALMVVAAIGLANVSSIFRLGRERVAIALGVSAELVLWCGSFMSMTSGGAAFSFGQRLFFFVGVPFIIAAAVYLPLLPKLDRWPPQAS
jgi:hypothetical protein